MTKQPYPIDICYDVETYSNCFSAVFLHVASGKEWIFEVSDRRNDSTELHDFLRLMQRTGMRMVGYNNVGFDYPVIHEFVNIFAAQGTVHAHQMHAKANQIIRAENRWANIIWPDQRIVPQLDLYLIHHFDNPARATSLKMLEVNMRSHDVQDLPFDPMEPVPLDRIDDLIRYNRHDVAETAKFYIWSLPAIADRMDLTEKFGTDFTNHNSTKIGKDFFIMELEKRQPGICFDRSTGRKRPRQTQRPNGIRIADVIFPYVKFEHPEFQRVLDYLKTVTITNTKAAPELKGLNAVINGFQFDFGTGGIHGSVDRRVVRSCKDYVILDADISSFYPNLAIQNRAYPQHLGEMFCDLYSELYETRKTFPRKSAPNEMYKLALNGVYGDSNNDYGPFKDPQYTMTITINGQLSLCMCIEQVIMRCDAEILQCNTDGYTVRIKKDNLDEYFKIHDEWSKVTGLAWEYVEYISMFVRDVNSYASKACATWDEKDGIMVRNEASFIKRIGAYQYHTPLDDGPMERGWHQDLGGLIIPKAAEAVMLRGEPLEGFIRSHRDPFDFMLRVRVPRSSRLMLDDEQVQNISRYYIARDGGKLVKIMPPTPRNPDKERHIGVEAAHRVALCNVASDFDWSRLDYDYYIAEARKLILTSGDLFASLA